MTEEQFERIRGRIDLEASDAGEHLHLLQGMLHAQQDYYLEMNESWTFWSLTFKAHYTVILSQLCKLYDKAKRTLSLKRFLQAVTDHPELFSDASFRKRLEGNQHIDTLAADRSIDVAQLAAELASVSETDPLVSRLLELRNKTCLHLDAGRIMQGVETAGLTVAELEVLLRRARGITAKYSLLFRASVYGGTVGSDDYLSTLRWVREALSAHWKRIEKETARVMELTGAEKGQTMSTRELVRFTGILHGEGGKAGCTLQATKVSLSRAPAESNTVDWRLVDLSEELPPGNYELLADGKMMQVQYANGATIICWLTPGRVARGCSLAANPVYTQPRRPWPI